MISKPIDDLIESYSDQLKQMLPMNMAALVIVACTLFWSAGAGEYKSIVLSALNSTIPKVIDPKLGLISIPIYAFGAIILGLIFGSKTLDSLFSKFLLHWANIPKIRTNINDILNNGSRNNTQPININLLLSKAETIQKKFQERSSFARIATLLGATCIVAFFPGNILDAVIGLVLIATGIVSYYFAGRLFVVDYLPIRAELRHSSTQQSVAK